MKTPKERREIYLQVAENISARRNRNKYGMRLGICGALQRIKPPVNYYYKDERGALPELSLFYPDTAYWWDYNAEGDRCRVLALLLSAEMTKTENL